MPHVHRPTGGGAVVHGHDLTFSLAVPLSEIRVDSRKLRAIYSFLVEPVRRALAATLRGEVLQASSKGVSDSPACFSRASAFDLTFDGTKIAGCALRVSRRAALLQVSIPVRPPEQPPSDVLIGESFEFNHVLDEFAVRRTLTAELRQMFPVEVAAIGFDVREIVDVALWDVWDPIGVNQIAVAHDEYSTYVELLSNAVDRERELHRIRSEQMAGIGDPELDSQCVRWLDKFLPRSPAPTRT
jgi:hypothetical protein